MEKLNPNIREFAHIYNGFLHSDSEAALNSVWQTIIFTVPVGHKEMPLLHQSAKARQAELRKAAADKKADEDKEKNKPLITNERDDNVRRYQK